MSLVSLRMIEKDFTQVTFKFKPDSLEFWQVVLFG